MPLLDRLLQREPGKYLYGTLAGGLAGHTPTPFLYSVSANNLKDWTSHGPLVDLGSNTTLDEKWCGEFGRNFECSNLMEVGGKLLLLTSTEGGERRWSIWITGDLSLRDGQPQLTPTASGVLDWGSYYAASVGESKDGRKLALGKRSLLLSVLHDADG